MNKDTQAKKQLTMFGTYEFPSYEEIMDAYAKEFENYILPKGDTVFGFWMQTLADLEFLDLELQGLTNGYSIDPVNRVYDYKKKPSLCRGKREIRPQSDIAL